MSFDRPVRHMREYLAVLGPLLRGEPSDAAGETITGRLALDIPDSTPVETLLAARERNFPKRPCANCVARSPAKWSARPRRLGCGKADTPNSSTVSPSPCPIRRKTKPRILIRERKSRAWDCRSRAAWRSCAARMRGSSRDRRCRSMADSICIERGKAKHLSNPFASSEVEMPLDLALSRWVSRLRSTRTGQGLNTYAVRH